MLHTITNWVRKIGSKKPRHDRRAVRKRQRKAGRRFSAFRPRLECLEDRIAPVVDTNITNLGLALASNGSSANGVAAGYPPGNYQQDGNLLAFTVDESAQGADLNGDGDTLDQVLEVYDASTGTTTNLGLALANSGDFQLKGNLLAFTVSESAQGGTDLNGDHDASDDVQFVYDASTGTTTNLGLASGVFQLDGNLEAFTVNESAQGGTDLNGDGDANDNVIYVYDASTGTTTNLGLAADNYFRLNGNLLAFEVSESAQGGTDLNGDGDTNDHVLHVYDSSTGITTNLGLATIGYQLNGNLLAFQVSESAQGGTDLNGDGDTLDYVMHVYDASTGTTINLGLADDTSNPSFYQLEGNLLAFQVSESVQGGTDLNGDGDAADQVLFVYDANTGTTTNLGLALEGYGGGGFRLNSNLLAFGVSEYHQGHTDLNGDGDTTDLVLYLYDANTGTTTNLGLAADSSYFRLNGNLLAFISGDPASPGLHVYDVSTGTNTYLGQGTTNNTSFQLNANLLAFDVSEQAMGTDLNGDGATDDYVLHVYDIAAGTITNLGIDNSSFERDSFGDREYTFPMGFQLDGTRIAVPVDEYQQGTDLNGDGDTNDIVLQVAKISIDTDGDGIADNVDTQPTVFSNDFSDGTTAGTITNRGDQQLTIVDAHNPADGVLVTAAASGGPTPATISVKGGTATYTINAGDQLVITDGNVITNVIAGTVPITFRGNDGSTFTTTLDGGTADDGVEQSLTFDSNTDLFTTPATNTSAVEVFDSNGQELTVAPGGIAGPTLMNFDNQVRYYGP